MKPEVKAWLYDILQSINEVEDYFQGKPMIFKEFENDLRTRRAVERNLEIIGEAVNIDHHFSLKSDHHIPFINSQLVWSRIYGTRRSM